MWQNTISGTGLENTDPDIEAVLRELDIGLNKTTPTIPSAKQLT